MKYQIIGKNISVTEGISAALERKLGKLDKLFPNSENIECRAVVSAHNKECKVEVTIFLPIMPIRAEVAHEDLYAAIDLAIDKLQIQLGKVKAKMNRSEGKVGFGKAIDFEEIEEEKVDEKDVIVRQKSYYLTPMKIDEAVIRMEALGHDFFVYLDEEDDRVSVVYHRRDGGYGVIQAENEVK